MVAKIKIGKSLSRAFFYNENKVLAGAAQLLDSRNFPVDGKRMSQVQRLNVLQKIATLNEKVQTNSVHISLNFDPSEQLSDDKLREIAGAYMQGIGFGQQPFLLYRHHDAGHPHVHLLTTRVGFDGRAISVHNIGKNQSEQTRRELEIRFGLVRAEDQKNSESYQLRSAYTPGAVYGKSQTKKAIGTVLGDILPSYKYTSLPELNAVLNLYNVSAERGSEDSRTFRNKGLLYRVLDDQGKPVGVPIKASLFYNSPTLKYLEERFEKNETERRKYRDRVKNTIDLTLLKQPGITLGKLVSALEKQGIQPVLRRNEGGFLYGITYIDHQTLCVFNGSALGKDYSAKAIQERTTGHTMLQPTAQLDDHLKFTMPPMRYEAPQMPDKGLLELMLQPEYASAYVPYELSGKKKRRRKRR